jgi:hypothetical protein
MIVKMHQLARDGGRISGTTIVAYAALFEEDWMAG